MKRVGVWRFEIEDKTIDLPEWWNGKGWEPELLQEAVRQWCVANKVTQGRWVNVDTAIVLRGRRRAWKGKQVRLVRTSRSEITLVVVVHKLGDEFKEKGERDGVRVEGDGRRQSAGSVEHAGHARRAGPAA